MSILKQHIIKMIFLLATHKMLNEIFNYIGFSDFVDDANDLMTEKPEASSVAKSGVYVPAMTE